MKPSSTKPEFVMMVGLPASGKSTFLSKYDLAEYSIVSSDNLIEEKAKEEGKSYDEIFDDKEALGHIMDQFFKELKLAIRHRENIIVDRTYLTLKSRNTILKMVPDDFKKFAVVVTVNEEEQSKRLHDRSKTGKTIPENVIKAMKANFVMPTKEEGFDHIVEV